jgi:hypothetical protein
LNRKDYLKFAQKMSKKQLKTYSVKKCQRKNSVSVATDGPQPASACVDLCGRHYLPLPLAAQPGRSPWPAYASAARCVPSN